MSDVKDVKEVTTIEEFHNNTFEPIEGVVGTPAKADEPQQVIQETIPEPPVKTDETHGEPFDAAKHYQSIADKRLAENERLKVKAEQLEAELNQFKQPKAEQVEIEEIPTEPVIPKDYDATEAITNPDSSSWKFREDDAKWNRYIGKQVISLKEQIQKERQAAEETKQSAAFKAFRLGQIQQLSGADIKEAEEIWDNFQTPKKDEEFLKDVIEFHRFKKAKISPNAQKKTTELEMRDERMKQPLPPGILPGKADDLPSPDELFNQSIENKRGNYSLK